MSLYGGVRIGCFQWCKNPIIRVFVPQFDIVTVYRLLNKILWLSGLMNPVMSLPLVEFSFPLMHQV